MLCTLLCIAVLAAGSLRAETTTGVELPNCDYSKFVVGRPTKIRGVLTFARYGGCRSANAQKWTTAYLLMLPHTTCDFEVRAPKSINLSQYDGYVVEATGVVKEGGAASFYTLTVSSLR